MLKQKKNDTRQSFIEAALPCQRFPRVDKKSLQSHLTVKSEPNFCVSKKEKTERWMRSACSMYVITMRNVLSSINAYNAPSGIGAESYEEL
jgi:hypothetical protein